MEKAKLTPLMQQYFAIREKCPTDTLLLFQVGDFYELFFDDAKRAAAFLALTLTKRGKCNGEDIPLCGVPVHAIHHYLTKLVKGGFRVAICDQLSEPKPGTIVDRAITQVFTPGTLTDMQMLDEKRPSYLCAISPGPDGVGIIFSELLTGQLYATTIPTSDVRSIETELSRFFPDEIVLFSSKESNPLARSLTKLGYWVSRVDSLLDIPAFTSHTAPLTSASQKLLEEHTLINDTLRLLYTYLTYAHAQALTQFTTISAYSADEYLLLDSATQRNLEIVENNHDRSRAHTLLSVVDKTKTPMGSRLLRKWLLRPLVQKRAILSRQQGAQYIKDNVSLLQQLSETLAAFPDLERITGRIALQKAPLTDYLGLKGALSLLPRVKALLSVKGCPEILAQIVGSIGAFSSLHETLSHSLNDEAEQPYIIKPGFDKELDDIRDLTRNAQKRILALEAKEVSRSGISSLKIRYNKISGYTIEVTKPNLHLVPDDYIRQQTLTNRERFVTKELLKLGQDIATAQQKITEVETAVFNRIKETVYAVHTTLRGVAYAIAQLDVLYSFGATAYTHQYIGPTFNDTRDIIIEDGRHPVVEQSDDTSFVPNPTHLTDKESLWIITGPNMGGKSTYLRQVALVSILAQCGSLVPAKRASLSILDRIFTRIGAGDNLAEGKSTFLVEMEETAVICKEATSRSLVILDEVGRGTSTYDGLAIAQAVIEHIFTTVSARCLFATHYHELTRLSETFKGISLYHMTCKKTKDGIAFLHKISPGKSGRSFGIIAAKRAALPQPVIARAQQLLSQHEGAETGVPTRPSGRQVSIHEGVLDHKQDIIDAIEHINLDELSPKKAFDLLWELKTKKR